MCKYFDEEGRCTKHRDQWNNIIYYCAGTPETCEDFEHDEDSD